MTNSKNIQKKNKQNEKENDDTNACTSNQENIESIMEEIMELLNIEDSYNKRILEIENITTQIDTNYPILNINLASSSLNFNQNSLVITPKGLQNSKRGAKDGIVLFGYERKNSNNTDNNIYTNLNSDTNNNNNNEESEDFLLNDFAFPIEERDKNNGLYEFPTFAIYFNTKDRNYYIKDFNTGIGALMKIKKYKMDRNTLINIGSNYLVVNLEKNKIIIKIFNHNILENNNTKEKKGKNCDLKEFNIGNNKNTIINIGRSTNCDITIDDAMLSKIHTSIEYKAKDKSFYLYDGNTKKESTNGTWVFILNPIQIKDNFTYKAQHTLFMANLANSK